MRAAAGRALAGVVEREHAGHVGPEVEALLLDGQDTAVTQTTAEALLKRGDLVGARAVLWALTRAERGWTVGQLAGEVYGWMMNERATAGREDAFVRLMSALPRDEDPEVCDEALGFLRPWYGGGTHPGVWWLRRRRGSRPRERRSMGRVPARTVRRGGGGR